MREFLSVALVLLALLAPAGAQEAEINPATKPGSVQIVFLPPPMVGTVSLGIYNKAGKLVRTLKCEAIVDKDFHVGLNGLMVEWDGKDDAGAAQKAGTYSARGYMVKGVSVSGEAYRGNDWMTDEDSPRVREITAISVVEKDRLSLEAQLLDGSSVRCECSLQGSLEKAKSQKGEFENPETPADFPLWKKIIRDGKLVKGEQAPEEVALSESDQAIAFSRGKDASLWIIVKGPERAEVQQYSQEGEFLRRLSIAAGEPVPEKIAASTNSDLIYLLERGPGVQRVRGLALENLKSPLPAPDTEPEAGAPKSSTWRIVFSKSIHAQPDFASVAGLLGRPEAPKAEAKIAAKLTKNPLGPKGEAANVEVVVVSEKGGSYLQTADGLTLCRLTDTPGLKWATVIKDAKGYSLVQSDGAVIEEYRLGKLTGMMAFDAGEYELKW